MVPDRRVVRVIGAGLGGLVAAVTAAELGAEVTVLEAHHEVGGRWRLTSGPYGMHQGPHVVYRDGPIWPWLRQRHLLGETQPVPPMALRRFLFRHRGRLQHLPPMDLVRVLASRSRAPVEESWSEWAGRRFGAAAARTAAAASGVGIFHPRPGDLSAAFVQQRLQRVFALPPQAGYRRGGWGAMLGDLAGYARRLGVTIRTADRISTLPDGPTIVATSLPAAAALLGDSDLVWPSGQVALLDLGLRRSPGDAFVVSDLDEGGWLEDFAVPDPTVAPEGGSAVQLQLPLRDGEPASEATARLERLADQALPGWRSRLEFRRDAVARGRTGAVDYPGRTWRDRPAIERGDGIYLVGDQVAAPGLLSEVSFVSAVWAAQLAAGAREGVRGRDFDPTRRSPRAIG